MLSLEQCLEAKRLGYRVKDGRQIIEWGDFYYSVSRDGPGWLTLGLRRYTVSDDCILVPTLEGLIEWAYELSKKTETISDDLICLRLDKYDDEYRATTVWFFRDHIIGVGTMPCEAVLALIKEMKR